MRQVLRSALMSSETFTIVALGNVPSSSMARTSASTFRVSNSRPRGTCLVVDVALVDEYSMTRWVGPSSIRNVGAPDTVDVVLA